MKMEQRQCLHLFWGVSYVFQTNFKWEESLKESLSLSLLQKLCAELYSISYNDPYAQQFRQ